LEETEKRKKNNLEKKKEQQVKATLEKVQSLNNNDNNADYDPFTTGNNANNNKRKRTAPAPAPPTNVQNEENDQSATTMATAAQKKQRLGPRDMKILAEQSSKATKQDDYFQSFEYQRQQLLKQKQLQQQQLGQQEDNDEEVDEEESDENEERSESNSEEDVHYDPFSQKTKNNTNKQKKPTQRNSPASNKASLSASEFSQSIFLSLTDSISSPKTVENNSSSFSSRSRGATSRNVNEEQDDEEENEDEEEEEEEITQKNKRRKTTNTTSSRVRNPVSNSNNPNPVNRYNGSSLLTSHTHQSSSFSQQEEPEEKLFDRTHVHKIARGVSGGTVGGRARIQPQMIHNYESNNKGSKGGKAGAGNSLLLGSTSTTMRGNGITSRYDHASQVKQQSQEFVHKMTKSLKQMKKKSRKEEDEDESEDIENSGSGEEDEDLESDEY
jgi:hypothetical protein